MKHRVYVIASEYSAPLALLGRTPDEAYAQAPQAEPASSGDVSVVRKAGTQARSSDSRVGTPLPWQRLFFSAPVEGRSWADQGALRPPSLGDLLASAAHRALGSLHALCGHDEYEETRQAITDLLVASMPLLGNTPDSNVNPGLIPLMLRATLALELYCHCQFVAGTADSGASAFASAVRIAQSRPATVLVAAGQIMPSGYTGQYRIRSVFTADEQKRGLDMMAMGDVLMDALRRTYAGSGFDLARTQDWLARTRQGKLEGSRAYPAALGVEGSDPGNIDRFVTRYFRSADVAKAGCGAAAVILTSDPELLGKVRRHAKARARGRGKRYRNTPVIEVVGVGEGTTDPCILARRSPLVALSSIRQALASAADDASLPLSVYPDSAFAVLHDAFPSMELAFLLAIGLDWQRASLRMTTWWSNPYGGLLTFGDAVGASGLVQIAKAFHVFTGDRRYIRPELNPIRRFRREGSYAFTSSVGGPLSHVVVSILRGGIPPTARDQSAFFDRVVPHLLQVSAGALDQPTLLARQEMTRRWQWQRAARVYTERLAAHDGSLWLIEGVTEIDARSCVQAIPPEVLDTLALDRLRAMIVDQHLAGCRAEVVKILHVLRADYLASRSELDIRQARERYDAGLDSLLAAWHERGALRPDAEIARQATAQVDGDAGPGSDQVGRWRKVLKQCIRVATVFLIEPGQGRRRIVFVPTLDDIDRADFMRMVVRDESTGGGKKGASGRVGRVIMHGDDMVLPWWNSRAIRADGHVTLPPARGSKGASRLLGMTSNGVPDPDRVFDALVSSERTLQDERQAELVFLRAYFAPAGPEAAVDLAIRDLGVAPEVDPELRAGKQVPAIFYKNDIIGSSTIDDVHEAYELLGRAVQRARGWFGMYASTCAQHGDSVSLVSLDRRLERSGSDLHGEARHARSEAISNASRFARDVAEWCLGYGIRLRTVVSFGHGVPYRDVNDDRSVASDSAIRGARLLDFVAEKAHDFGFAHLPWIVFDLSELGDIEDAVSLFERELLAASGPDWRIPPGPSSPVALERWSDIRFTVWYRPEDE